MNENANEIVKALRLCAEDEPANCINCPGDSDVSSRTCSNKLMDKAADLIESLQAQLSADRVKFAELQRYNVDCTKQFGMLQMDKVNLQNLLTESQQETRAAVEDMEELLEIACRNGLEGACDYCSDNGENCTSTTGWRGPQAGKGETE